MHQMDSGVGGMAFVMQTVSNSFAPRAFSIVHAAYAAGYYTFGHELGHNMGLMHDRANSSFPGAYPYAYGHQEPNGAFAP